MVNSPLFTTLNQMRAVSGIPIRVTASETWYKETMARIRKKQSMLKGKK